ncbi:dihydrofolate reductase family protein [Devosia sp.]|uniref:dihydrofolate reductase family protein n=1 Tax=Devosia sp. TaxID=1871048 RepID=UPI0035B18BBF
MRRLLVWNVMSLDGYFEGTNPWDLSFHGSVWGDELEAFSIQQLDAMGLLLFGRKTYQGMADYWQKEEPGAVADRMNAIPKAVASTTLKTAEWHNTRLLSGDAATAVRALKGEDGGDIFVFGSAALLETLLAHGLVDEYRVCIAPVVLGAGTPLFKPAAAALGLSLLEARPLETGGVLLRYAVGASHPT